MEDRTRTCRGLRDRPRSPVLIPLNTLSGKDLRRIGRYANIREGWLGAHRVEGLGTSWNHPPIAVRRLADRSGDFGRALDYLKRRAVNEEVQHGQRSA